MVAEIERENSIHLSTPIKKEGRSKEAARPNSKAVKVKKEKEEEGEEEEGKEENEEEK